MPFRHWLRVTRAWVERRDAILRAQEDAAIRAARDSATTDEERALVETLIEEREWSRKAREGRR